MCVYARARADVSVHVSDIHCYGISVVHESSMAIRPTLTYTRAHAVRTVLSLHWHLTESVVGSISATMPSPVPTRSSPVGASAVHSTPYDMRVFVRVCVRVCVGLCVRVRVQKRGQHSACACACVCASTRVCVSGRVRTRVCAHARVRVYAFGCTRVNVCVCARAQAHL